MQSLITYKKVNKKQYNDGTYYKFSPFTNTWIATAGVMSFVQENECFWVLDVTASYIPRLKDADYLKVVTVKVDVVNSNCVFKIMDEISGELIVQKIPYTDLKEDLTFWAITEDERTVVLLPSEY